MHTVGFDPKSSPFTALSQGILIFVACWEVFLQCTKDIEFSLNHYTVLL